MVGGRVWQQEAREFVCTLTRTQPNFRCSQGSRSAGLNVRARGRSTWSRNKDR